MKSLFESKTVWLGVLVSLIPFLEALKAIQLPTEVAQVVSMVLGVLIIINRFYTTGAVSLKKPEGDI